MPPAIAWEFQTIWKTAKAKAESLARRLLLVSLFLALPACHEPRALEPRTITDDLSRTIRVPAQVRRLVTLAPNLTELIVFCGCEDLLVGTDEFSNYPARIRSLPKVGGLQPSLERLAQLEPDLVLASTSGNQAALAPALDRLGIALYTVRTERLADIPRSVERLASILCGRNAARQAGDLRTQIESQRRQRGRAPKILFLVWPDPLYVAGRETFIDDLITLTGGQNGVEPDVKGWPQYSLEAVVANPPDLIVYPGASVRAAELETLFERDRRWASLPVVKKKLYLAVDEDLFTRPGPRIAKAAETLNRLIDQWEQQTP